MKKFSNKYIYIYSAVLVIIIAAVLALISTSLSPFQQKNIKAENMQKLLASAGINVERAQAEELYGKYFTKEISVNAKGEIMDEYTDGKQTKGTERPFDINIKNQYKKVKSGDADAKLPVYVCSKDGKTIYVVPVRGNGLWGDIWGNVALDSDLNTVVGVNFDHESETPGLGANITTKDFQDRFIGKQIFEGSEFVSVGVQKRVGTGDIHKVDAITGATLTSNGVNNMLADGLRFFVPYFNTLKK